MAVTWNGNRFAAPAGADLSLKAHHAVALNSNGEVVLATAGGADMVGVLRDNPKLGYTATVQHQEIIQVCIGAAVSRNARVAPRADGRFITAVTGNRSTVRVLEPGTVDGQLVTAVIDGGDAPATP